QVRRAAGRHDYERRSGCEWRPTPRHHLAASRADDEEGPAAAARVHPSIADHLSRFQLFALMKKIILPTILMTAVVGVLLAQDPPQPPKQQTDTVRTVISNTSSGLPPRIAVPDFIPLTNDPDTVAAAKLLGQVLWDDL